ncbi:MAG TPA: DEAD/DEAH box helicase [Mycobacteriales bacterium]|nr:DEAD/DEAH box helicase [Mycobacteriales bacterium]
MEHLNARPGHTSPWPTWVDPDLRVALERAGIAEPWTHQAAAADLAWAGQSVVVSSGTASGKSLCYLLPALTAALTGTGTTVYLAPTKALAADQLRAIGGLGLDGVRAATYDGDTPLEERDWARRHADLILTNPDMLHHGLLPAHSRWSTKLRKLRFVVVDECHHYRGVFGSHVAQVLRRVHRIARHYGADPVFILASATVSDPGTTALRLVGVPAAEVTEDGSPRGAVDVALWEPPLTEATGENGAPVRRPATAEAATLLADLVAEGVRTVAFVRSRRGAESVSLGARRALDEAAPELVDRVAAYRGGYLAEDRRALERELHDGELLGLASTNALELGVDISGLDAVLIAGWPGTHASLWQQAGRAGRAGRDALAVLIARDDPLDTYLIHHPAAVFGRPVEAAVLDPDNRHVLRPHLAAAAAELPLTDADTAGFGPAATGVLDELVAEGLLRRRANGWYWTAQERATDLADLRGTGGPPVRICEVGTGRLLGTVDAAASHAAVHPGAVYLHQGATYVVEQLDLEASVALVERHNPDWTTHARDVTDIRIVETRRTQRFEGVDLHFGTVDVTSRIVSFLRRRLGSGEVLGEEPLDLPPRQLRTQATWWVIDDELLAAAQVEPRDLPGSAHAAEHASIGLMPLVATCDRWDIGGMSTALHPDTLAPTVFVYDGHAGGAGFAERGYDRAQEWLSATRDAIAACECTTGCPSCVQSPKCGNGNEPLDKAGAVRLLSAVVERCWDRAAATHAVAGNADEEARIRHPREEDNADQWPRERSS